MKVAIALSRATLFVPPISRADVENDPGETVVTFHDRMSTERSESGIVCLSENADTVAHEVREIDEVIGRFH
jgi:hypothetical protein